MPEPYEAAQTELIAVNSILSAAGEDPVSALGTNDSAMAEQILDEVNREVQSKGWFFNKRFNVVHTPTAGEITMATNVISVDTQRNDILLTIRNGKLYNMATGTDDEFTGTVKLDIIELLPFTDCPEVARNYMVKMAGVYYLQRIAGDESMVRAQAQATDMAYRLLMREEVRVQSTTIWGRRDKRIVYWRNPLNHLHGGYGA